MIGLVRNKKTTDEKVAADKANPHGNLTIIQADVTDRPALWSAASEVAKLTGGPLDYLINNAGYVDGIASFKPLAGFSDSLQSADALAEDLDESFRVNVHGVINTVNAFMPLVLKGKTKKVITLSTGLGDTDFTIQNELDEQSTYGVTKAATNMVVAKYHITYKKDGVLFLAISPGVVATHDVYPRKSVPASSSLCRVFSGRTARCGWVSNGNGVETNADV